MDLATLHLQCYDCHVESGSGNLTRNSKLQQSERRIFPTQKLQICQVVWVFFPHLKSKDKHYVTKTEKTRRRL